MSSTRMRDLQQGVAAGLAGTAAMTVSYGIERRLRRSHVGPLDYDDGVVPTQAAMLVLRIQTLDEPYKHVLGLMVHWGYGSLMGYPRRLLGRRFSPATATVIYWGGLTVMVGILFPLLGDTPPPWKWKPDVLATSLVQHAVYAITVGVVADAGR